MPLYLTKMSKKDRHLHFTTHTSTNCTLIHPDSYKIEAIVFARDSLLAENLVKEMFEGYPATFSAFTVIGGNEMDLEKIYRDRPELMRISPDVGYVYSEFAHKRTIARYFK